MAVWIWYPQDFEIDLRAKVEMRRREHGMTYPSVWRIDAPSRAVHFIKEYTLKSDGEIRIFSQGAAYCSIDGVAVPDQCDRVMLPAGKHMLKVDVMCLALPALYIDGALETDASFLASDDHARYVPCGWSAMFNTPDKQPEDFHLPTEKTLPVCRTENGYWDFGRETFGFVHMTAKSEGNYRVFYGESIPECDAGMKAELWDSGRFDRAGQSIRLDARALRYLRIDGPVEEDSVYLEEENNGLTYRAAFHCSDERLNAIYDVSARTMELCTREFFLDGIKRDRWLWAGDALQSVMMNPYSYFDSPTSRRTLAALRGREPFTQHVNTILDYTFYWVIAVWEDYFCTGDVSFIRSIFAKMVSMIDYTLDCCNEDGFIVGRPMDWVFVDWADMSKEGELCIEQVLLWKALTVLADSAGLLDKADVAAYYRNIADRLRKNIFQVYWSDEKGTLLHQRVNGEVKGHTRYAPMFALMYDMLTPEQAQSVIHNTLLGGDAPQITTPYMRFYEMDALMRCGEAKAVVRDVKDYWGGMLELGATSIWEQFDPEETGDQHYAMYGRPFGRSLCHCWGAGPIYLCGRYLLGVRPTSPGFTSYEVAPQLGGIASASGRVPTPDGNIDVTISENEITVISTCSGTGTLRFDENSVSIPAGSENNPTKVRLKL